MTPLLLLLGVITLYSIDTLFIKSYQVSAGTGRFQMAFMNLVSGCAVFVALFILKGFQLHHTLLTLFLSIGFGIFFWVFSSLKAAAAGLGPLAIISMACVMGGVLIPTLYGFLFLQEAVTVHKIISILLIFLSFVPLLIKQKKSLAFSTKFLLCCLLILMLNGALYSVSKVAQAHSQPEYAVDYVALYYFFYFLTAVAVIIQQSPHFDVHDIAVTCSLGNLSRAAAIGLCNAGASVLNYRLGYYLPASVQFPLTQSCMLIIITLTALLMYREKPRQETMMSMLIAIASIVFMSL